MPTAVKKAENPAKAAASKTPFFGPGSPAPFFQPRLTVNQPGDKYEKEADSVADQVMRMQDGEAPVVQRMGITGLGSVQRACAPCEQESGDAPDYSVMRMEEGEEQVVQEMPEVPWKSVQRMCSECEKEQNEGEGEKGSGEIQRQISCPHIEVQRKCNTCEQEEIQRSPEESEGEPGEGTVQMKFIAPRVSSPQIQTKCAECEKEEAVQKKGDPVAGSTAPPIVSSVLTSGGGRPLDSGLQHFMESRIGIDFSGVRVHTGGQAAESASAIQAKAYTSGSQIVFGEGQYQPETDTGRHLIAHELVHVGQQGGGIMRQEAAPAPADGAPAAACPVATPEKAPEEVGGGTEPTQIPDNSQSAQQPAQEKAEGKTEQAPPSKEKAATDQPAAGPEAAAEQPAEPVKTPDNPKDDPGFQDIMGDTRKAKNSQEQHDTPEKKAAEAESSAENPADKDAKMVQAGKVMGIDEGLQEAQFDKNAFKRQVLDLVSKEIPRTESVNKQFQQNGKERLNKLANKSIDGAPNPQKDLLKNPDNAPEPSTESKGQLFEKEVAPPITENPGKKVAVGNAERAIPKPHTDAELALDKEHDAESLDRAMEDDQLKEFNAKLTEDQLSSSNEPQFTEALSVKKEEQAKLCQVPSDLRQKETEMRETAGQKAGSTLQGTMVGKHGERKDRFGNVNEGKDQAKSKDELLLENYYKKIAGIFDNVKKGVDAILKDLDETIPAIFEAAVDRANTEFKKRVKSRLDDYYGVGITNLSEEDEDEYERDYNKPYDKEIKALNEQKQNTEDPDRIAGLNQRIESLERRRLETIPDRIFKQEKAKFVGILDTALDTISEKVAKGMNDAKALIAKGKSDIDCASACLPANLQKEAEERTADFKSKFDDLQSKVDEKQKELAQSLAREYSKNVNKLKETFEEIRKESAMSWWERAWNAIKKIALIVYNLGKLLVKVLVKGISVIGDIVAHPIRFIGNLITAIGDGFRNFVNNIGTHLENIIFKLILGTIPPGIKFPTVWDVKGIFSFALELLGLTKENIRAQAVDRLGEPVVSKLEEAFDLFVLFKKEGFAGLWEHIKEKIGDLKDQVIEQVKEYFKESIIKAAVKFLLSALTPASGFIKACETIINVAIFFMKNLENILKLLDSILDSFIDIAKGNLTSAALRVENALADILLIGIKFLAALVGINLDAISSKVQRVFNAIRNPVNRAIKWLLDKAVAFAERTGLLAVVRKGQQKIDQGKEWAKEKGKAVAGAVLGWLGLKKGFRADNGEMHTLYFQGKDENAKLILASNSPGEYERWVNALPVDKSTEAGRKRADQKQKAIGVATEIDRIKRRRPSTEEARNTQAEELRAKMDELSSLTGKLFTNLRPACSTEENGGLGFGGLNNGYGTSMIAQSLTNNKMPPGSVPSVSGNKSFNIINQRRYQAGSYYILGHLLNHNLGGTGREWKNLTPLTRVANKNHEHIAESRVKNAVNSGNIVYYKVTAEYGRSSRSHSDPVIREIMKEEANVPLKLICEAFMINPDNQQKTPLVPAGTVIDNSIDQSPDSYDLTGIRRETIYLSDKDEDEIKTIDGVNAQLAAKIVAAIREKGTRFVSFEQLANYEFEDGKVFTNLQKTNIVEMPNLGHVRLFRV